MFKEPYNHKHTCNLQKLAMSDLKSTKHAFPLNTDLGFAALFSVENTIFYIPCLFFKNKKWHISISKSFICSSYLYMASDI